MMGRLKTLFIAITMIAVMLVGLGHRPVVVDAQAQAFLLAGGSWAELCGTTGDPRQNTAQVCDACLISGSCAVPAPITLSLRVTLGATSGWPVAATQQRSISFDLSHPARAPPFA